MNTPQLFEYVILWHPTEKQIKDEGAKSMIIAQRTEVLSKDFQAAQTIAAMEIPPAYKTQIDQIQIVCRPF